MNKELLFEIGTEEIPARFMKSTLRDFKANLEKMLSEARIAYKDIEIYGTPRRFTIFLKDLAENQEDLETELKGPAKRIAFDENNNPSKPLEGFLKSKNLKVEDIYFKVAGKEEYAHALVKEEGKETKEVLMNLLPDLIKTINFPKSMRWGGKNLRFVRPIRWMVCLFGGEILPVDLEGIVASDITKGHRFLGQAEIKVTSIEDYKAKMKENFVILDQDQRREEIRKQCLEVANKLGGTLMMDEDLLEEINYIVEYPTAFYGEFAKEYTELPKEVVITPMKEHQRYFPIEDKDGKLMANFITVRNGDAHKIENVKKGNEKVLAARLSDAHFFYKEDTKRPLEAYREKLKSIVFQEKLGTVYDKSVRIEKNAAKICDILNVKEKEAVVRTASLCKADLTTNMVFEFTELQGIMGRYYAISSNESEAVANGILEHYQPKFAGDELPSKIEGIIVSIADKMDSLAGFFALGIQPTGSQDPYALRRQALGVLNILMQKDLKIKLKELIEVALDTHNSLEFDREKVTKDLEEFFKLRVKNLFLDMGIRYDVIDAVIDLENIEPGDRLARAQELNKWISKAGMEDILTAFGRVSNLAANYEEGILSEELFVADEEKELFNAFKTAKVEVLKHLETRDYSKALDSFSGIKPYVDNMFDTVMIMDKDERIKNNRLAFLKEIKDTMMLICDLSKIVYK